MTAPVCPFEGKHTYPSKRAARRHRTEMRRANRGMADDLAPYKCGPHWHLGHPDPVKKRIPAPPTKRTSQ